MEEEDMYLSVKSRLRKPSAKLLANTEPGVLKSPPSPVSNRASLLVLQSAVAESSVAESDEYLVEVREFPVTIESVDANDWRQHGWSAKQVKGSRSKQSSTPNSRKPTRVVLARRGSMKDESSTQGSSEALVDSPKIEEIKQSVETVKPTLDTELLPVAEDDSVSDAGSRNDEMRASSPAEGVKRKRGRPFKGQEKPIEERLMIETSKIRRLIDDIMRKGNNDSAFCLRLRTIISDLDEAMAMGWGASSSGSPSMAPIEAANESTLVTSSEALPEVMGEVLIENNTL
jgi:hypothetical protein